MTDAIQPPIAGVEPSIAQMEQDRFDVAGLRGGPIRRLRVAEALLKARGAVVRAIREPGPLAEHVLNLMLVVTVFGGAYGAMLGWYGGPQQALYAAIKVPVILLGTTFLCLPTFYVFNSILGSRLTLGQATMLLLLQVAALAILLVGFAPIAWFFSVSTGGPGFLTWLHVTVFAVALLFGIRWLDLARRYLRFLEGAAGSASGGFFLIWITLFVLVGCQMAYYFRPLLLPGPFHTGVRGLFVEFFRS